MTAVAFSSSLSIPPTSEEALPGKLWIKFNRECLFSIYSPFAVCLAAGNLKIDTFRQYIAQDVHFLKAFAHA
jgi:thiaminase